MTRLELQPYFGTVQVFEGFFQRYGRTEEGRNTACIAEIAIDGLVVADHAWIHRSQQMYKLNLRQGDVVTFEARVGRYSRELPRIGRELEYDYRLEKIRDFKLKARA